MKVNDYKFTLSSEELKTFDHRTDVGGKWDEIGYLQISFMKSQGLEPHMKFLDIGCGCLRGGKHFINYLKPNHYFGIDCNRQLIEIGRKKELGLNFWKVSDRSFLVDDYFNFNKFEKIFDSALAFSLFTHLPSHYLKLCLHRLSKVFRSGSQFYATFWLCEEDHEYDLPIQQCDDIVPTTSYKDPYHYSLSTIDHCLNDDWEYSIVECNHPRKQQMLCFLKK